MLKNSRMAVQPRGFFDGPGKEALTVRHDAFGVEITLMIGFRQSPKPSRMPGVSSRPWRRAPRSRGG